MKGVNLTHYLECTEYTLILNKAASVLYLSLSMASANERRRYICNVFSHWLRPCSFIDRKRAAISINDNFKIRIALWLSH